MPAYDQIPSLAQQGLVAGWQTGEREQALIDQERARQFEQDVRLQSLDLARQQTRRAQEELAAKRRAEQEQADADAAVLEGVSKGIDLRTMPEFGQVAAKASPTVQRIASGDVFAVRQREELAKQVDSLRAMSPKMLRKVLTDNQDFYKQVMDSRVPISPDEMPQSEQERKALERSMGFNAEFDLAAENGLFTDQERARWMNAPDTGPLSFRTEYTRRQAELDAKAKAGISSSEEQRRQQAIGAIINKVNRGEKLTDAEAGFIRTQKDVSPTEYLPKQPPVIPDNRKGRVDALEGNAGTLRQRRTAIEKIDAQISKAWGGDGWQQELNPDGTPAKSLTGEGFWNNQSSADLAIIPLLEQRKQLMAEYAAMGGDDALSKYESQAFGLRDQLAQGTIYNPEDDFMERFFAQNGRVPTPQEFAAWKASAPTR